MSNRNKRTVRAYSGYSKPGVRNNRKRNFRQTVKSFNKGLSGVSYSGASVISKTTLNNIYKGLNMLKDSKNKETLSKTKPDDDFGISKLGNSWTAIKSYLSAYGANSAILQAEWIKNFFPGGVYEKYNSTTGKKSGVFVASEISDKAVWITLATSHYWYRFIDALEHSKMKPEQVALLTIKIENIIRTALGTRAGEFKYFGTSVKTQI